MHHKHCGGKQDRHEEQPTLLAIEHAALLLPILLRAVGNVAGARRRVFDAEADDGECGDEALFIFRDQRRCCPHPLDESEISFLFCSLDLYTLMRLHSTLRSG